MAGRPEGGWTEREVEVNFKLRAAP
jgi:hypothetical protein